VFADKIAELFATVWASADAVWAWTVATKFIIYCRW